jgi:hypothetical protein
MMVDRLCYVVLGFAAGTWYGMSGYWPMTIEIVREWLRGVL